MLHAYALHSSLTELFGSPATTISGWVDAVAPMAVPSKDEKGRFSPIRKGQGTLQSSVEVVVSVTVVLQPTAKDSRAQ